MILYVRDHDRFYSSTGELPASVQAHMQAVTQGSIPRCVPLDGYQTTALMLGLAARGRAGLAAGVRFRAKSPRPSAAQVTIAVARAIAIEATARMEAAREGERLRTALIDSLTHELRTPLTSIRAAATTLLEGEGLDEAAALIWSRIIDEESARLDLLIGEAVEMAEIDANVVQVKMSPQHPRALLDQAVEESRKILASHKVSIAVEDDSTAMSRPGRTGSGESASVIDGSIRTCWAGSCATCSKTWPSYTPPGSRVTLSSGASGDRLEFCRGG